MKRTALFIGFIIFLFSASNATAWWSAVVYNESTHHKLSDSALAKIDSASYPDIIKFKAAISNWTSGPSDDANAHDGTAIPNDGSVKILWRWSQEQYMKFNFATGGPSTYTAQNGSAYYYIANIAHLVEDQAVPAHVYNIRHGGVMPKDHMEELVYNYAYNPTDVNTVVATDDTWNYEAMWNITDYNISDPSWRYYWMTLSEAIFQPSYSVFLTSDIYPDGKTYWFSGVYGGDLLTTYDQYTYADMFPVFWVSADSAEKDITGYLLGQAAAHTAGALMKMSETLPPLTKELSIDGSTNSAPAIDTTSGSNITFNLYENRQPDVYVNITVDSPDGQAIVDADSGVPVSYV